MLAREWQHHAIVGTESKHLAGDSSSVLAGILSDGSEDGATILEGLLLAQALIAVFSHSVSHLVAEHHGELVVAGDDVHDALINDDFAARHAEGVELVVLDEVKLPSEVLHLVAHAVRVEVGLGGGGNLASHACDLFALYSLR